MYILVKIGMKGNFFHLKIMRKGQLCKHRGGNFGYGFLAPKTFQDLRETGPWPQLLSSRYITVQQISTSETNCIIVWIEIWPRHSSSFEQLGLGAQAHV